MFGRDHACLTAVPVFHRELILLVLEDVGHGKIVIQSRGC